MESAKFLVQVENGNGLTGSVEVLALSQSSAKQLALRKFFKGWTVVSAKKVN